MRGKPFILIAALATSIVPNLSEAVASRRFTGSACVYASGSGVVRITSNDGAIYNDSSSDSVTVDCPVLGNFAGTMSTALWYLDNSPSSISCTYRSEAAGSTSVVSETQASTGDDNFYRSMTFNVTTLENAYTHIRCTIPPRDSSRNASYIVGYAGN